MKKVLFVKSKDCKARWIDNDKEILESRFKVIMMDVQSIKGFGFVFALLNQFLKLLFTIHKYQVIYIWFADYHSFFPVFLAKIFRKKSFIVVGGYDADEILIKPAKSLRQKVRKFCVSYSIKHCYTLLPVSDVIKKYLMEFTINSKCHVVYNCVNANHFDTSNLKNKENLIITIGGGGQYVKEVIRKRIDLFLKIGNEFNKKFPEYKAKFIAIGHDKNSETYKFLRKIPEFDSVMIAPLITDVNTLTEYLKRASIYMQLSFYESFGIAQAEAMLYECIPVSNPGGAIPEVVGDAGFLVEKFEINDYTIIIKEILDKQHEVLRAIAKQRILTKFSFETRKDKLLKLIDIENS